MWTRLVHWQYIVVSSNLHKNYSLLFKLNFWTVNADWKLTKVTLDCIKHMSYYLFQYKTEKDGVIETRIERKMVITSDGDDIDHDAVSSE